MEVCPRSGKKGRIPPPKVPPIRIRRRPNKEYFPKRPTDKGDK